MDNKVLVTGIASGEFRVNHQFKGKNDSLITALETEIISTSFNQVSNVIKVIVFKDSLFEHRLKRKGATVTVEGYIQNFHKQAYGRRISEIFVKPTQVHSALSDAKQKNTVELIGDVCGEVVLKTRHSGRLVAEAKVKVKRINGGFDYIPVVAFDENARILEVAGKDVPIILKGRIHSRSYRFKYEENGVQKEVERTAIEVCAHELKVDLHKQMNLIVKEANDYYTQPGNLQINQIICPLYDISDLALYRTKRKGKSQKGYKSGRKVFSDINAKKNRFSKSLNFGSY